MTRFYHCFETDLPDQFVQANAARLIRWADGWDNKHSYRERQKIIDTVSINLTGDARTHVRPLLRCASPLSLASWMRKNGDKYDGRYWESLAEDQRCPDAKSGGSWGGYTFIDPSITISRKPAGGPGQGFGAGIGIISKQIADDIAKAFSVPASMISGRSPVFMGVDWATEDKPPLKREGIIAGEIIGYRCWRVDRGLLRSVYQKDVWHPNRPLEGRELGDWDSRGIHAWKDRGSKHYHDYVRGYLNRDSDPFTRYFLFGGGSDSETGVDRPAMITGTVFLWGDVVEHERGWRAEYARVRSLDWLYPDELMMGREQQALDDLRAKYGVKAGAAA